MAKILIGNFKGPKGETGPTGATGAQGAKGATGATGPQGTKGETGAQGATGPTGSTGPQGVAGAKGATGQRGSQWYSGTGITGTSTTETIFAASGVTSALVGDYYLNTSTGYVYRCTVAGAATVAKWVYAGSIKGATGAQGPIGATGSTGPQGAAGATGATGAQGATGPAGATGPQGVAGAKGATGQRGSQWYSGTGITGTSATEAIFSGSGVTSALVGDYYLNSSTGCVYRCTVAGAATVAKWVYAGNIKGATGTQGPIGATGPTGPQGAAGATGATGSKGATGATGPQGATGPIGATGQRGSQWYSGTGITGTSTTATIFSGSGVTSALVGDWYLNTSTGYTYQCTVAGAASVAKWAYKGSIKGATGPQGAQGVQGPQGPAATPGNFLLTGYSKGSNVGAIAATDNILTAIAKLENRVVSLEEDVTKTINEIKNLMKIV